MKADSSPNQNRIELLQGTLDMLILQTLRPRPLHEHAISQALRARSSEVLQVETGLLYLALPRLERHGLVASKWSETDREQRAQFYSITATTLLQLARDRSKWEAMVAASASVFHPQTES